MIEELGNGQFNQETNAEEYYNYSDKLENEYDECDDENEIIENEIVVLYDLSLTLGENFQDGIKTKYILLPINAEGFLMSETYTPLLNAGAKIVMDSEKFSNNKDILMDFFVLDYDTMFGIRLLTFQKYNSDFFSCDERVFFETLLIKFHYFNFRPFFISYPTIQKELGIKKDRLVTIAKKFEKLGFLTKEIKTSIIDKRPSQVTYYFLDTNRILELLPQIYNRDNLDDIEKDLKKYLQPAFNKKDMMTKINIDANDEIKRSTW